MALTYLKKSQVVAVAKELTYGVAPSFTDLDTIEITDATALKGEVSSVERKVVINSFVSAPKIAGKETVSGTLAFELIPEEAGVDLNGSDALEAIFGIKEVAGMGTGGFIGYSDAGITVASEIFEAGSGNTGTATIYKLAKPCGNAISLSIKEMYGCSTVDSQSVTYKGIVPTSLKFDFPVADIVTASLEVGGNGFSTASGETLLVRQPLTTAPFIGKNAKLMVSGVPYEGKDLSFSIDNTVVDRETIVGSGVTQKIVTAKVIKGSLKVTFKDFSELNKLKNNVDGSVYIELTQGLRQFAIYLPKIRYTMVNMDNADGVLETSIEFEAYQATSGSAIGEAILLAIK